MATMATTQSQTQDLSKPNRKQRSTRKKQGVFQLLEAVPVSTQSWIDLVTRFQAFTQPEQEH